MDIRLHRDSPLLGRAEPVHHRRSGPGGGALPAAGHLPGQDAGGADRAAEVALELVRSDPRKEEGGGPVGQRSQLTTETALKRLCVKILAIVLCCLTFRALTAFHTSCQIHVKVLQKRKYSSATLTKIYFSIYFHLLIYVR